MRAQITNHNKTRLNKKMKRNIKNRKQIIKSLKLKK